MPPRGRSIRRATASRVQLVAVLVLGGWNRWRARRGGSRWDAIEPRAASLSAICYLSPHHKNGAVILGKNSSACASEPVSESKKNPHCETRHHQSFDIYRRKLLGSSPRAQARKATEQVAILETQDDLAGHCMPSTIRERTNVPHGRASSSRLWHATLVCAGRTPLSIVPCLVSLVTATVTSGLDQSAARRFHTITITVSYRRVGCCASCSVYPPLIVVVTISSYLGHRACLQNYIEPTSELHGESRLDPTQTIQFGYVCGASFSSTAWHGTMG